MQKKVLFLMGFIFFAFLMAGCSQQTGTEEARVEKIEEKEFVIAGSGSNLPITGKLVEQFNEKYSTKLKMPGSIGSGGGIKAVTEGAIDIGLTSRILKDKEKSSGLTQIPYARVGIVMGVNENVPDNELTYEEIVNIYAGKKTSWKNGKMIVVLMREKGDSSNRVLKEKIPGFKEVLHESQKEKRWQTHFTDAEAAQGIVNTPWAIGLTDTGALTALNLPIKPLKINGVEPTVDNIINENYELYKELFFVYKEPLTDRAKKFIDFVFSDQGSRIILSNGGIPLGK